jgi:hypothetical protein
MPLIKTNDAGVAAGATVTPWTGSQYEYLPWNAHLSIALLADAGDTFNASVFSGSDVLLQDSPIDALAVATPIRNPDDYSLSDFAAAGERLGCNLTNTAVGAGDVRTSVIITPV